MTIASLPIRRLAIEWRYAPTVAVYSKMDEVVLEHQKVLPTWERSPLSVEIRSGAEGRKFGIAHNRCFLDKWSNEPINTDDEITFGHEIFQSFAHKVAIETLTRIGMRQWIAFPRSQMFSELVVRSNRAFFNNPRLNEKVLKGHVDDVGFTIDLTAPSGKWKYHFHSGPMERAQYLRDCAIERKMFESDEKHEKYRTSIPETMLFVDIDCYIDKVSMGESQPWLREARRFSQDVCEDFLKYFDEA